jgi:hypothetical protein
LFLRAVFFYGEGHHGNAGRPNPFGASWSGDRTSKTRRPASPLPPSGVKKEKQILSIGRFLSNLDS